MSAGTAPEPIYHDIGNWIKENEKDFLPPVCNKMMHNYQLKVFYVGGPNQRKDFHLEEGEELFYMRKGDMCLKVMEGGKFKNVHIREGEIFLLPGRIPHSPQREANTVGLVIERDRALTELDGLRYFVEGSTESLYEKWFHCEDLGKQLKPVIEGFFASEQYKTGKPIPSELPENPPWTPDSGRRLEPPFSLTDWINSHKAKLRENGVVRMFDERKYESDILLLGGTKPMNFTSVKAETLLWQVRGKSSITISAQKYGMKEDGLLLIPTGTAYTVTPDQEAVLLSVHMDPNNKSRITQKA